MSDRQKAIQILQRFQQAVADKLTELVIEREEELLGEVDQDLGLTNDIYDLAEKLRVVSVTLSVMPAETAEQKSGTPVVQDQNKVVVVTTLPEITIRDFLACISGGDFESAARTLSHIFGVPLKRAAKCTEHFVNAMNIDPEGTMQRLGRLADELTRSMNRSLELMENLFGMLPSEALQVVRHLKASA